VPFTDIASLLVAFQIQHFVLIVEDDIEVSEKVGAEIRQVVSVPQTAKTSLKQAPKRETILSVGYFCSIGAQTHLSPQNRQVQSIP